MKSLQAAKTKMLSTRAHLHFLLIRTHDTAAGGSGGERLHEGGCVPKLSLRAFGAHLEIQICQLLPSILIHLIGVKILLQQADGNSSVALRALHCDLQASNPSRVVFSSRGRCDSLQLAGHLQPGQLAVHWNQAQWITAAGGYG